jgi:hypothetical protein
MGPPRGFSVRWAPAAPWDSRTERWDAAGGRLGRAGGRGLDGTAAQREGTRQEGEGWLGPTSDKDFSFRSIAANGMEAHQVVAGPPSCPGASWRWEWRPAWRTRIGRVRFPGSPVHAVDGSGRYGALGAEVQLVGQSGFERTVGSPRSGPVGWFGGAIWTGACRWWAAAGRTITPGGSLGTRYDRGRSSAGPCRGGCVPRYARRRDRVPVLLRRPWS